MIQITKCAILFWTWVTLANCSTYILEQPYNLTSDFLKNMFSEKEVFYNPLSKQPVPPLSQSTSSTTKIRGSKNVYGTLPCNCLSNVCNCCVDIKIKQLNSDDNGCVSLSPSDLDGSAVDTVILLNNQTMGEARLSCHLRGCAKLEVRVTGTDAILWDMQFSCFKIGTDGIMFNNPNKNKEKPKPVKESNKEPVTKPMKKPNEECH